jgi:hypothetical protein
LVIGDIIIILIVDYNNLDYLDLSIIEESYC